MPRLPESSSDDDCPEPCSYDGSYELKRAFSELSSYYSGLTGATDLSSSELTSSSAETSTGNDDDEEDSSEDEYESDEASESSSTSSYSTHPSDTSYELSTLIEETDREKLGKLSNFGVRLQSRKHCGDKRLHRSAKFVRLRPVDKKWINAAWKYTQNEPTFRRRAKVKVYGDRVL
ncbi:hypothetical protein TELCIR_02711 [Teladorsagia circumcincta]|uniref:Uncharacterized protein n=1 Tax=Teladorsagia circumcincta TaxID=45464 RepID=A0A2G9UYD7_TELCI|nr:hypothetical protein TELCIR_02711 [Teladorsagia circumcincta]